MNKFKPQPMGNRLDQPLVASQITHSLLEGSSSLSNSHFMKTPLTGNNICVMT